MLDQVEEGNESDENLATFIMKDTESNRPIFIDSSVNLRNEGSSTPMGLDEIQRREKGKIGEPRLMSQIVSKVSKNSSTKIDPKQQV